MGPLSISKRGQTQSFDLYHDYTETREGVDRYLNIVKAGSRASNPSARSLASREALQTEALRGIESIARAGIDVAELVGDVWHRAFGRPRNAVVLPAGYYVVGSSIPGTISLGDGGRVRLDFWNGRPDEIDVLVRARRR